MIKIGDWELGKYLYHFKKKKKKINKSAARRGARIRDCGERIMGLGD